MSLLLCFFFTLIQFPLRSMIKYEKNIIQKYDIFSIPVSNLYYVIPLLLFFIFYAVYFLRSSFHNYYRTPYKNILCTLSLASIEDHTEKTSPPPPTNIIITFSQCICRYSFIFIHSTL